MRKFYYISSYICLATSYKLMSSYLCSHGYSHEQYSGSSTNQEKNPKGIIFKTWIENNTIKLGIMSSTLPIKIHLSITCKSQTAFY